MTILSMRRQGPKALPLLLLLGLQACGLETVDIPELTGPSELALALTLQANPDWVVADNESVSNIVATLRGPTGQPVAGRVILFTLADATGIPAFIGELSSPSGQMIASGQSATGVTNGSGVTQVRFSAPARTDLLAATTVVIAARPQGTDASAAIYKAVRVEVVPAEPRLFPPNDGNDPPTCRFITQPSRGPNTDGSFPIGFQILFQSTSSDSDGRIVRYEWDFGDESGDLKSDVNHAYRIAGTYTVRHFVTDNNGALGTCPTRAITVK